MAEQKKRKITKAEREKAERYTRSKRGQEPELPKERIKSSPPLKKDPSTGSDSYRPISPEERARAERFRERTPPSYGDRLGPEPKPLSNQAQRIQEIRNTVLNRDRLSEVATGEAPPARNFPGVQTPSQNAAGKVADVARKTDATRYARDVGAFESEGGSIGKVAGEAASLAKGAGRVARIAAPILSKAPYVGLALTGAGIVADVMGAFDKKKNTTKTTADKVLSPGYDYRDQGINPSEQRNRKPTPTDTGSAPEKLSPASFQQPQTLQKPLPYKDPGATPAPTNAPMARTGGDTQPQYDTGQGNYGPNQVGGEQTQGGFYPTYRKDSPEATDFRSAFAKAVADGVKQFPWQGRIYNTNTKS